MTTARGGDVYIPQLFWIDHDSYSNRPIIRMQKGHLKSQSMSTPIWTLPHGDIGSTLLDSRESTVNGIKWLVSTLEDPYSKYLTREELEKELQVRDDGFLGLGAIVEIPPTLSSSLRSNASERRSIGNVLPSSSRSHILSLTAVKNLPQITAIAPDSPAERAGLVVGDRVVAVGADKFLGLARDQVIRRLSLYTGADNYFGYPELTIAKPVALVNLNVNDQNRVSQRDPSDAEELIGYKMSKARLRTASLDQLKPYQPSPLVARPPSLEPNKEDINVFGSDGVIRGGDAIVHWQMITSEASIFSKHYTLTDDTINPSLASSSSVRSSSDSSVENIGYIRLTRFSRSSTAGFVNAVSELERSGAKAYIIDLRNNYGGVIQEAMLTAASLLRDPHAVLCYTINSRGGFTPHDVEEYIIDKRYPGYLLSSESKDVAINQAKRDDPGFFSDEGWTPPSAFASLHEQRQNRHIVPSSMIRDRIALSASGTEDERQFYAQKKVVILQNEGTASAAEVFVSSLRDNGRLVGTVGSKTYGKGLIQHTLPLPDGGGLRLTVAEYLTPSLQHVTKIGGAQYDSVTGKYVGGGLSPDVHCDSRGIPSNVGADLCVGVAIDLLSGGLENGNLKNDSVKII
jgi:C-terminal processing protease CtpA/Prc